jgi:hypothetical protein
MVDAGAHCALAAQVPVLKAAFASEN